MPTLREMRELFENNQSQLEEMRKYGQMVGKKVSKIRKGGAKEAKPFKSGLKVNTVKDVIYHPILKNFLAFTFEEDDSFVECRRCFLVESE